LRRERGTTKDRDKITSTIGQKKRYRREILEKVLALPDSGEKMAEREKKTEATKGPLERPRLRGEGPIPGVRS